MARRRGEALATPRVRRTSCSAVADASSRRSPGRDATRRGGHDARARRGGRGVDLRHVHPVAAAVAGAPGPDAASTSSACSRSRALLMLRQPDVLHLHDQRLLPRLGAAAAGRSRSSGVFATSVADPRARSTGFPWPTAELWILFGAVIIIQTLAIGFGVGPRRDGSTSTTRQRRRRSPQLEAALVENAGLHAPAGRPGPRGGRPRRAPADGARDPRHDRPGPDRDRHAARGGRAGARPAGGLAPPPRQRARASRARA